MRRLLAVLLAALAGCSTSPIQYATLNEHDISLQRGELEAAGIAFVTPSTITGQEQEKQTVALTFADVMSHDRPGVKVVTLAETLNAVNKAGLVDAYRRMYEDYRDTALLPGEVLRRLGASTGARYIGQLKLQGFAQSSKNRFGVLGLRIMDTQLGDVRLYFQIWDSRDGAIVWEGMQELRVAVDTTSERPVTLRALLEHTAHDLIAKVP
jgi:hypothetical protein